MHATPRRARMSTVRAVRAAITASHSTSSVIAFASRFTARAYSTLAVDACWNCGDLSPTNLAASSLDFFCVACGMIQPPLVDGNHFKVLGVCVRRFDRACDRLTP